VTNVIDRLCSLLVDLSSITYLLCIRFFELSGHSSRVVFLVRSLKTHFYWSRIQRMNSWMAVVTKEISRKVPSQRADSWVLCLQHFGEFKVRNVVSRNIVYCGDKDTVKCVAAYIQHVSLRRIQN